MLLDEWLPSSKMPQKDQAFAKLALTYFQSHGPATIQDFSWWSGLTITEATQGVRSLGSQLFAEKLDNQTHYMLPESQPQKPSQQVFLLPNYDEYFVAYKDRRAAIDPKLINNIKQLGNGIFTSPIVINGLMAGYWKRSFMKDKVLIETNVVSSISKSAGDAMEAAARRFGKFLKMPIKVSQNYG